MFGYPKLNSIKYHPKIKDSNPESYWFVNDRYAIYNDKVVYDTKKAEGIPQWVFEIRDNLIKKEI